MKRSTQNIARSCTETFAVNCPTGKVPLGGGLFGESGVTVLGSGVTSDGKGWRFETVNSTLVRKSVDISVTCAAVTDAAIARR